MCFVFDLNQRERKASEKKFFLGVIEEKIASAIAGFLSSISLPGSVHSQIQMGILLEPYPTARLFYNKDTTPSAWGKGHRMGKPGLPPWGVGRRSLS